MEICRTAERYVKTFYWRFPMFTSFWGLFLFSTALSLVATFIAVSITALVRRIRAASDEEPARLR